MTVTGPARRTVPAGRRLLTTFLTGVLVLGTAACDGGSEPERQTIRIGMISNIDGSLEVPGSELRDGFQLYLDMRAGQLGGHPAELILADEGYEAGVVVESATKLLEQDRVSAVTGIINGGNVAAILPLINQHKVPLVGALGRPALTDVSYVWHTNLISVEPGVAMAPFVRQQVKGGTVFAIGPDFQSGRDELRGFVDTFTDLGGRLANPDGQAVFTPFPITEDFGPYLDAIAASGADAIYCFFDAQNAITFVKQYAESSVADLPLYAAGFVTEPASLIEQGDAAEGIYNGLNYSPDLDNAANREFVSAWNAAYPGRVPTSIVMASYDAAAVLDRAIAAAGTNPSPQEINTAIAGLGQLNSPRGPWQFARTTHAPIQKWYLRQVRRDGRALTNVVVSELATLGG
ncbi:branched-chain amino acid transport system substrate-binding protein [Micromonospora phaseoli]|uniref:Branched-chain amino acid transport system substrate-binding protein n=1 Tax=Micromonospora phaseoli TaxID=1144548 RepID=A0A1H7ADS2_9ACTN|nr:ABC transporter substrate-binding protein [Micromonospora phaseoli]PZV96467.1 amino acid/amide ABC transporter substrate-binding protein (HAAT family) [Micromonospora phaseoli]GIJ76155.1 ABC transporter substrate-binding protein [Micromonospora phaseoli]SEJ63096.1 branched-chain amino acid transport system substrate-binding protein [Micromonospora phaseoli]